MRILLLCHAFNSLTQRLFVELKAREHKVSVEFDINDEVSSAAVALFQPDLIIAPFLKRAISESIWRKHVCLIVHPGIVGDRGPSALDWAILNQEKTWGVTVLQATAEMDAGPIWASAEFPMRKASKASLYRNEVTEAASQAVLKAVSRFIVNTYMPQALADAGESARGQWREAVKRADRRIDWQHDTTQTVLRKIRSADGYPGLLDQCFDRKVYLYDARAASKLRGEAGQIIAYSGNAICRASIDGAVWIGHLRDASSKHPFKLPATQVLQNYLQDVPCLPESDYAEIWYQRIAEVGYLHFPFYNGAMSVEQCQRLLQAYREALAQPTRAIVLMGGADFWSNGMHLNQIEAADSAPDASWENINAIDDLAAEIIRTDTQITVAALQGNTGAGGVFLARACDVVWARSGVILNPHYKDMGNLYGSEYWTYLMPRHIGADKAATILQARLPMGMTEAVHLGLVDAHFGESLRAFNRQLQLRAEDLVSHSDYALRLSTKANLRAQDEENKPLEMYRNEELQCMKMNFYGFDPSYHIARYNFVYKIPKSRTPLTIALHRKASAIPLRKAS